MAHTSEQRHVLWGQLERLAQRVAGNSVLQEDLFQEALIHIWRMEKRRPGQTQSWYLQSCKFHLQHYLSSGRSIDSPKRRADQWRPPTDFDAEEAWPELVESGASVFAAVSARDLVECLSCRLLAPERAVLHCLADGLGPREIGRKLRMSHTSVIKQRRKIASLLVRLEDLPPERLRVREKNGHGRIDLGIGLSGEAPPTLSVVRKG